MLTDALRGCRKTTRMSGHSDWKLGLIDSAWFGSEFEGLAGLQQARRIGFDSFDLFIGFDPGRMISAERDALGEWRQER